MKKQKKPAKRNNAWIGVLAVAIIAVCVVYDAPYFLPGNVSLTAGVKNSGPCSLPVISKLCAVTSNKTLTIGQLTLTANGATNATGPFITNSDQSKYTNTLNLKSGKSTVTLGFSALAGGHINYFSVNGFGTPSLEGRNLDNIGYGQGWQSTLRDQLHNLRYNPAIVGFSGYRLEHDTPGAGAPVQISDSKNGLLVVRQANVPLYQGEGKGYDFTQHEDVVFDNTYTDGGQKDSDNLPEIASNESDEIRSEFDYTGSYLNTSTKFGIPSMRHDLAYAYMRNPNAILQFTNPKDVDDDGKPVYIDGRRMLDLSLTTPGNQTASSTDLSDMLPTYGIRLYPADFTTVLWTDGGVWKSASSSPKGLDRTKVATCQAGADHPGYRYISAISPYAFTPNCHLDNDLLIISSGADPNTGFAIGMYAPQDMGFNSKQTWLVDKDTMQVVSREDRRLQVFINSTGGNTNVRALTAGLRSPLSLAAAGFTHHFEMFTSRTYILFGTPNQIKNAVEKFKQSAQFKTDAAQ